MFKSDDSVGFKCSQWLGETEEVQVHLMQKYKNHAFVSHQVGIKPTSGNFQCSDIQIIIAFSSYHILFGHILQFIRNMDKYITDSFALHLTLKQTHTKNKAKTHETTGRKGSQAPNTSRTNIHFEEVTSHFLFVHLNFLSLSQSSPIGQGETSLFCSLCSAPTKCPAGKSKTDSLQNKCGCIGITQYGINVICHHLTAVVQ